MAVDITQLITALSDQVTPVCNSAAEAMGRDVQLSAPIGQTGRLSQDWDVTTDGGGTGATSTLKFNADYASYVDEGTSPHPIHGNPLLAFEWGGVTVIVHSVNHPGTTATNFFTDKANDDGLWSLLVQAEFDSTVIS